jgi:DinB superfamily
MTVGYELITNRPDKSEYDPYYQKYVALVPETEIIGPLEAQLGELQSLVEGISEERGTFAYEDGKWTIKEVFSHLIDAERIFSYRAFRIARGDKTPVEGFEQDGYIENSHANRRSFGDLLGELMQIRQANLAFFKNLDAPDWVRTGTANNVEISVRSLAWIMAGHIRHHIDILKSRYLM